MGSSGIASLSDVEVASDEEAFLFSYKVAIASLLPVVMKCAVELNLLELIKNSGPVTAPELANKISSVSNAAAAEAIDRILYLLACNSILLCEVTPISGGGVERRYSLAPAARFLTKNEDGASLVPLLLMNVERAFMDCWSGLKDAVVEGGIAFSKAHGMSFYEYLDGHSHFRNLFNTGMSNHSTIITKKLLDSYDGFDGISTLVDVGGGDGTTLSMIISKHPHLQGVILDLEHVLRGTPSYPGIQNVVGDMFVSVPKGDAIFLKWILHNWSDAHCETLLKNCYEAIPPSGKVIVVDSILPDAPDLSLATQKVANLDIIMLGLFPGGKERTEEEFRTLAARAGFKHFRRVCSAYNLLWVMELTK